MIHPSALALLRNEIAALKEDVKKNPDPRLAKLREQERAAAVLERQHANSKVAETTPSEEGSAAAVVRQLGRKRAILQYLGEREMAARGELLQFLADSGIANSSNPAQRLASMLSTGREFERVDGMKGYWRLSKAGRLAIQAARVPGRTLGHRRLAER
jgi:hypothetical protein